MPPKPSCGGKSVGRRRPGLKHAAGLVKTLIVSSEFSMCLVSMTAWRSSVGIQLKRLLLFGPKEVERVWLGMREVE